MSEDRPVIIVEPDVGARRALTAPFDGPTELDSITRLESHLNGPAVVVLGPTMADAEGVASMAPILTGRPAVGAILVAEELTTELLQQALRAGFRDVLVQPLEQAQLVDTVARVASSLPGMSLPTPTVRSGDDDRGRVITVFSTKGGAGKSVLATNIGVSLAKKTDRPVVLVDADLQFGDVSVMLKLAPRHTIVDAVNSIDKLDQNLLHSILVRHEASGLYVLSAPLEPAFADQIGAKQMVQIVEMLRDMAAYVIIDTPAYFNDVVLALIEESDDVLLMAGMDIPNIKNVRIGLQTLRLLNTPMSKIRLILNRSDSKVKLDISEVERTLQIKAECRIPSDVAVPQSVNKGEPIVTDAPKSGPSKAIEALVKQLVEEGANRR